MMKDWNESCDKFTPSEFSVMIDTQRGLQFDDVLHDEFHAASNIFSNHSFSTKDIGITAYFSDSIKIAYSESKDIILILHGYVLNKMSQNLAELLLKEYLTQKESFVNNISGSFIIFIINKADAKVQIFTDPINSRKVFFTQKKNVYWLSSKIRGIPLTGELDINGVSSYLANEAIFNGRTIFKDVVLLERASVYEIKKNGINEKVYWKYEFTNEYLGKSNEFISSELKEILYNCIKSRLVDQPKIFLSLSGGYDACGLLGLLKSFSYENVQCFSYFYKSPPKYSDPMVAKEIAESEGYKHMLLNSYKGDFVGYLKKNSQHCQGQTPFCDELDAWLDLVPQFGGQSSILMVADECFGWPDWGIYSIDDIFYTLYILRFNVLNWLEKDLDSSIFDTLKYGLDEDFEKIIRRCPKTDDLHEIKDFLYLDQRISYRVLMWREYISGQYIRVDNPLLDKAFLDFIQKVPTKHRIGKNLYKKTVTQMFPRVFAIPRARTAGFVPNWEAEFIANADKLKEIITAGHSSIDEIISPKIVLSLIDNLVNGRGHVSKTGRLTAAASRRLSRNFFLKKCQQPFQKFLNRYDLRQTMDVTTFLKRYLNLRLFLNS